MNPDIFQPGYFGTSRSQISPRVQEAMVPYGANFPQQLALHMNEPYNSQPIPTAYADVVRFVLGKTMRDVDNEGSWELQLANRIAADAMQYTFEIKRFDNFVLERAAPNAPFPVVNMKKERHTFTLESYNIGIELDSALMNTERGIQMLKEHMETFRQGLIRTYRWKIQTAIAQAQIYWSLDFGVTLHRNLTSIQEFCEQEIETFGAITLDPKSVYKLAALVTQWTSGRPGSPKFNTVIIPYQAELQNAWRHDYHTEAWRAGDAAAERNIKAGAGKRLIEDALPLNVLVSKPINAINLGDGRDLDPFERTTTFGSFTVLECTDKGPKDDTFLVPIPAIRTPTADVNGFAMFNMLQMIEKTARFSKKDGRIEEFTNKVIKMAPQKLATWGGIDMQNLDAFVTVYKNSEFAEEIATVCKIWGEQHEKFRPFAFDVKQGILFKKLVAMSQIEEEQFDLIFMATEDGYQIDVANPADLISRILRSTSDAPDDEWGAHYLKMRVEYVSVPAIPAVTGSWDTTTGAVVGGTPGTPATYLPSDEKPYGLVGDIPGLMATLKNPPSPNIFKNWPLGKKLDYNICRRLLYRIFRVCRAVFPDILRTDALPSYRQPTSEDNRKMILLFRGWLERAKFPLWERNNRGGAVHKVFKTASNGGDAFFATSNTDGLWEALQQLVNSGAAKLAGSDLFDFLTDAQVRGKYESAYASKISGNPRSIYYLMERLLQYLAITDGNAVGSRQGQAAKTRGVQLAFTLAYMLRKISDKSFSDDRDKNLDHLQGYFYAATKVAETRGLALGDRDILMAPSAPGQWTTKGLMVWKEAYGYDATNGFRLRGTGGQYAPTNALVGDVPLTGENGGAASPSDPTVFAAAKFGQAHEGETKHFGFDPRQFITASSANSIGGPFYEEVFFDNDTQIAILPRPNISERCNYVADKLAEDPLARFGSFCFLFSEITKASALALVQHGLTCPMNFILAWPFIRIRTLSILFAETGRDFMQLVSGFEAESAPTDGVHMMEYRRFEVYMAAYVTDPAGCFMIEDAALAGYQSGLSSDLIDADKYIEPRTFKPEDFDGAFVIDVPVTFTRTTAIKNKHNPIPLTGFYNETRYGIGNFSNRDHLFSPSEPHFPTFPAYDVHFGFSRINEAPGAKYTIKSHADRKASTYIPGELYLKKTQVWNEVQNHWTIEDGGTVGTGKIDKIPEKENMRAVLAGRIEFKDRY